MEMKTVKEIKEILASHKEELEREHKVREIGIFGSYVRGEEKADSDADILVEFGEPVSLLELVGLEVYLSKILGIKVDVVPKEDIRPELKQAILKEAIYL